MPALIRVWVVLNNLSFVVTKVPKINCCSNSYCLSAGYTQNEGSMFIYFIPGVTPGILFDEPWTAYINAIRALGSVKVTTTHNYHPQRSCSKVVFLHLSVSHSVHRGDVVSGTPSGQTPPGRHPTRYKLPADTPWQAPPADTSHPYPGQTPSPADTSPVRHPPGRHSPSRHPLPQIDTTWTDTPWSDTPPVDNRLGKSPPRQTPPSPQRSLQRTVRILLECFLVTSNDPITYRQLLQLLTMVFCRPTLQQCGI